MTAQPRTAALPDTAPAAGLVRVSDEKQEKEGYSLADQERRIRAAAAERGLDLLTVERDVISGTRLSRPGLDRVLNLVKQHPGLTVITVAIDRFSRGGVGDGFYLKKLIELAGGQLVFLDEAIDPDDTDADLKLFMGFWKAKGERDDIVKRTQRGKRAKIAEGKLPGYGPAPYGYTWRLAPKGRNAQHLVRVGLDSDPIKAPVVRAMFTDLVHGRSLAQIAANLDAEGIPTPGRAAYWRPSSIRDILRNPVYCGDAYADRWTFGGPTRRTFVERPVEERTLLPGVAEPIVDRTLWERAQGILDFNRTSVRRLPANPEDFLLRSRIRCVCCGSLMTPQSAHNRRYLSYRCTGVAQRRKHCPNGSHIAAPGIDADIWRRVEALLLNPERLADYLDDLEHEADPGAAERDAVAATLTDLQKQQTNLLDNLRYLSGTAAGWVRNQLATLAGDIQRIAARLAALEAQSSGWAERRRRMAALATNMSALQAALDSADFERRRWILSELDVRVVAYPKGHTPRWEATWDGERILEDHSLSIGGNFTSLRWTA